VRIAITGTTSGIGREAVGALVARGHEVVALGRGVDRVRSALEPRVAAEVECHDLDLADPASIRAAAERVAAGGPLDALVHNAAVFDQRVPAARFTPAGHELFWATNHLGPFELTARLSAALAAAPAPRVLFVASKGLLAFPRIAVRFDALDDASWFTPTRAYYHAKLAHLMTALSLAESAGDRVAVSCLRVPSVRLDPERLAEQPAILRALYAPKGALAATPGRIADVYRRLLETSGTRTPDEAYVDERCRPVRPPAFARDPEHRRRLWATSQRATGDPSWAWPTVGTAEAAP
jgi:Short-chain dehydrogenases of various substrate specificities